MTELGKKSCLKVLKSKLSAHHIIQAKCACKCFQPKQLAENKSCTLPQSSISMVTWHCIHSKFLEEICIVNNCCAFLLSIALSFLSCEIYFFCLCICCLPFHTQKTKAEPVQRSLEKHLHDETAKFRTKLAGKQHLICISFIFRSFFHRIRRRHFPAILHMHRINIIIYLA